jgi:catechol 2,3-dioxygenase-like lactoylglutathione lyase family enzyme
MTAFPRLLHTVLDTTDARGLAEFYRQLLGLVYRPGDEPPAAGEPDPRGRDWLVLCTQEGARALAFQQVAKLPPATWPDPGVPQQLHLDLTVPTAEELDRQNARALELGARLRLDRRHSAGEPLYAYADPAGHPFCIFVA